MSNKCPFWSTQKQTVKCYGECPMLCGELVQEQEGEQCIFCECTGTSLNNIDFNARKSQEYSFFNFSIYDDEKKTNINY